MTTRKLEFPPDRRVGDLMFMLDGARQTIPARGIVEVPFDAQVTLISMPRPTTADEPPADDGFVAGDLAPVASLGPDDLHGIFAGALEAGSSRHATHLTGLSVAGLMGDLDDDDFAAVTALPRLTTCSFTSATATGTGLEPLVGRDPLAMLQVSFPRLTAEGAEVIGRIPSQTLVVSGPAFTADLLDAMGALAAPSISIVGPTIDREAVLRLLDRSPAITAITCMAAGQDEPVLDPVTALELRKARPDLTIDGTWLGPKALARLAAARPT